MIDTLDELQKSHYCSQWEKWWIKLGQLHNVWHALVAQALADENIWDYFKS